MGKINLKAGYTLIEVMTVAGIMALFSLTIIGMFLATLRGGTKSQVIQQVHQNGDFALKTMARMVRASTEVLSCGSDISIINPDGGSTEFSLVEDSGVERIASNSSRFLTGIDFEVSGLSFSCYNGDLGNQVVTIEFTIMAGGASGSQAQEKLTQEFATSISTRQY